MFEVLGQIKSLECERPLNLWPRTTKLQRDRTQRLVAVKNEGAIVKTNSVAGPMKCAVCRKGAAFGVVGYKNARPFRKGRQIGDSQIRIAVDHQTIAKGGCAFDFRFDKVTSDIDIDRYMESVSDLFRFATIVAE